MAIIHKNSEIPDHRIDEEELMKKIKGRADSEDDNDSGFGTSFTSADIRLMNRDGSLNVKIQGLDRFKEFNLYKQLVKLTSFQFYCSLLLFYVIINALFATVYYFLGLDGLSVASGRINWWDAFFFSTQTFTTVGYGHISPQSFFANIVASTEAFVGLLYFAIATGLVYGRFSNSRADIRFSEKILISDVGENQILTVRIANITATELSDLKAQIIMSWIEVSEMGRPIRRYRNLKLEIDHINLLTTSWTLVHKIEGNSPCKILNNKLEYAGLEYMVFISAFDEIFDQKVKVRRSYTEHDIVKKAKFVPITSYGEKSTLVNLDKLSDYEMQEK